MTVNQQDTTQDSKDSLTETQVLEDGTGDGSLSEKKVEGKEVTASDEQNLLPRISYRMNDEDRGFEYNIVRREDGKYDLDEDSRERIGKVLPMQAFQSRFHKTEAELNKTKGELEIIRARLQQKEEEVAKMKQNVSQFEPHLRVLQNPNVRQGFERTHARVFNQMGYDPRSFDPNAVRGEQLAHQERRIQWQGSIKPWIESFQVGALREVYKDTISDDEIGKVMGFLQQNRNDFLPELIEDPQLGYPTMAFVDTNKPELLRRIAQSAIIARKTMIADGLLDNPEVKKLRGQNQELEDSLDRARINASVKAAGAGGKATSSGKKQEKKPKMSANPATFTEQWLKLHPEHAD